MEDLVLDTLRLLRLEKKYSQEYMSSQLEISQSSYGRIENGKIPLNVKMLFQILVLLEVDFVSFAQKIKDKELKNRA